MLMTRIDGDYRHYGLTELREDFQDVMQRRRGFIANVPKRLVRKTLAEMRVEQ